MEQGSAITEHIRRILRPYSANWSGMLGRGDLLIPQRDISRVVEAILDAVRADISRQREASDAELFEALMETRRADSVQDQMNLLLRRFRILCK